MLTLKTTQNLESVLRNSTEEPYAGKPSGAAKPQPRGTLNIERPTLNIEYLNALHFTTEPRAINTFLAVCRT